MADHILVTAPDKTYPITIQPGLLTKLNPTEYGLDKHVVIITNPTLKTLNGDALALHLPHASIAIMPDGEQYKSLATVAELYRQLVDLSADRHTTIVALGGGVVGDTAGFAAATYMRGVRLVQIPTSLLAMVDSSVGGKVGVDLPEGKNLVGAFLQPDAVLIDPDVLATLPANEWRCGMAEILKHGLLADETLLDPSLHTPEKAPELIRRAVQVKVDVVQADPYEKGIRARLNLGHTFAHAIERVTEYRWLHGEAVGLGLLAAAHLSHTLGLCAAELVEQIDMILAETGLPRRLHGLDSQALYAAMATDKKWQQGKSRFILLRGICQPEIVESVPKDTVIAVLEMLQ
jgi:3-dehydroquinate synthase